MYINGEKYIQNLEKELEDLKMDVSFVDLYNNANQQELPDIDYKKIIDSITKLQNKVKKDSTEIIEETAEESKEEKNIDNIDEEIKADDDINEEQEKDFDYVDVMKRLIEKEDDKDDEQVKTSKELNIDDFLNIMNNIKEKEEIKQEDKKDNWFENLKVPTLNKYDINNTSMSKNDIIIEKEI